MIGTSSTTLWYATRATGVVALVLLSAAMVLGVVTAGRVRSRTWPASALADLHKRVSVLSVVFLALHVLTSVLDTYVHIPWSSIVVPFTAGYRPLWTGLGTVAVDVVLAVAISSALRQRISARAWRAIHWSAYASWPVAMAHSLGEGTDATTSWMVLVAGSCALAVAGAISWRVRDARRNRLRAGRAGASTRTPPEPQDRRPVAAGMPGSPP